MRRRRTALAVVIAVALVAAGVGYGGWRVFGRHRAASGTLTHVDRRFGWTMRYPASMHIGTFSSQGMFESDGVWVATFDAAVSGTCCPIPNTTSFRRFPPAGVAFMVWFGQRLPGGAEPSDSAFPLSLDRFNPIAPYVGGAEPRPLYLSFQSDAISFAAAAWLGPKAAPSDRRAIASMVASIRFPVLRAGTFWQNRYYVIGPAMRYPAGSVTPFDVPPGLGETSPHGYYLVHTGADFDVLPQVFSTSLDTSSCDVLHLGTGFACESPLIMWDLSGRLRGRFGPASRGYIEEIAWASQPRELPAPGLKHGGEGHVDRAPGSRGSHPSVRRADWCWCRCIVPSPPRRDPPRPSGRPRTRRPASRFDPCSSLSFISCCYLVPLSRAAPGLRPCRRLCPHGHAKGCRDSGPHP